jgi:diguanylate cyclase (GGDEF)-like protein
VADGACIEEHQLTQLRRYRQIGIWTLALVLSGSFIVVGYLLRQINVVFNPVPWASVQVIASFLAFGIAANVLVRFLGTNNRTSLLLGSTFGVIGFIQIVGIIELHHRFATLPARPSVSLPLFSGIIGQTLLAVLLLLAFPIERRLSWPRQRRKTVIAVASLVAVATYLIAITYLALLPRLAANPTSILPRPSDLIPAGIFIAATFVLRQNSYRNCCAFDAMLVWVAGLGAICHLIAAESSQLLDAPSMAALLLKTSSFGLLAGATLIDNVRLFGEVRNRAISDSLTGLANYRQFLEVLQTELERTGRTNRPFSILLMDLDGLKEINDQYGHLTGSRAICRVADVLRQNSRSLDTAARYGGDEFALILPETNDDEARRVSDRIRQHLASDDEAPRLSLSIGIATYPEDGASVQLLLDAADRELYSSKVASKNSRGPRQLPLGL